MRKSSRESLRRSTSPSNRMVQTAPNGFGIKQEVLVSTAKPTPKQSSPLRMRSTQSKFVSTGNNFAAGLERQLETLSPAR
jgi:hypothetical protein